MFSTAFSTRSLPPRDRAAAWSRTIERHFGALDTEADERDGFEAAMDVYELGDLQLFRIRAPAHRVGHHQPLHDGPAAEAFKLVLQVRGEAVVEQRQRRVTLRPGEWTLYDPRVPYDIVNRVPMEEIVLRLPRHSLGAVPALVHWTDDPALGSLHRVVSGYLRCLANQLPGLPAPAAHSLSQAAMSLVGSALCSRGRASAVQALPELTRERVKELVAARLSDPDLTLDVIARSLHCSKRYLHKVFEEEGLTLERYIWQQRLARCHEALAAPNRERRSISQVAFAWGFGSAAHFARQFKARYGVTPSEFCAQASTVS